MLNRKIIICANSIEEAEADLAMIKANARAGAVVGCGASTIEGMRGLAEVLAMTSAESVPYDATEQTEPHTPDTYIDLEYLFDDYRKGYIGLAELVEGIENAMTDNEECEDCPCDCCCCDDDDDEENEGYTIESAMAYFFGGEWD